MEDTCTSIVILVNNSSGAGTFMDDLIGVFEESYLSLTAYSSIRSICFSITLLKSFKGGQMITLAPARRLKRRLPLWLTCGGYCRECIRIDHDNSSTGRTESRIWTSMYSFHPMNIHWDVCPKLTSTWLSLKYSQLLWLAYSSIVQLACILCSICQRLVAYLSSHPSRMHKGVK